MNPEVVPVTVYDVLCVDLVLGVLIEAEPNLVEGVPIGVGGRPDFELIIEGADDREPNREVVDVLFQVFELLAVGVVSGVGRQLARDQDAVATVRFDEIDAQVAVDGRALLLPEHADPAQRHVAAEEPVARLPVERLVREEAEAAFRLRDQALPELRPNAA